MEALKACLPTSLYERFKEVASVLEEAKTAYLQASILQCPALVPLDKSGSSSSSHWSKHRDVHTEVGMSVQSLVGLGLISGQIMEIENVENGIRHVVRVVAVGFDKELNGSCKDGTDLEGCKEDFPLRGVVYVSPMLVKFLQLNCHLAPLLSSPSHGHHLASGRVILRPVINSHDSPGGEIAPPTGAKIVIQKVGEPQQSPFNSASKIASKMNQIERESLERALRQFFKETKRFLSLGDTFGLFADGFRKPKAPWKMFQTCCKSQDKVFHYFRVIEVEPKESISVLVDPEATVVSLKGGSTWGGAPMGLKEYAQAGSDLHQLTYEVSGLGDIPARSPTACLSSQALESLGDTVYATQLKTPTLKGVGPLLPAWKDIAKLICPALHSLAVDLDFRTSILLKGPKGCGRKTAAQGAARALGMNFVFCNSLELLGASDSATSAKLTAVFERSLAFAPCILILKNVDRLCTRDREAPLVTAALFQAAKLGCSKGVKREERRVEKRLVVVVGTSPEEGLAPSIRRCFTHELSLEPPDPEGRSMLLHHFLGSGLHIPSNVLEQAVKQTNGFLPKDLRGVAADTLANAASRSRSWIQGFPGKVQRPRTSRDVPESIRASLNTSPLSPSRLSSDGTEGNEMPGIQSHEVDASESASVFPNEVKWADFEVALGSVQKRTAHEVGAPKVPDVRWEDVGGLEDVKKVIMETVELPLAHRELFEGGVQHRSGVLLYGPPGVGKTLIAKAIATECSINFLSVKGPELLNMYIGESERHVREVFERARRARPCVVFFDELDSIAPARGAASDSAGVMDRVVSQLLAEIDDIQGGNADIFIFGATNRPDLVDPALTRPGRLDALVYVGLPTGPEARAKILRALTRKFDWAEDVDLFGISQQCSELFTGADLYALCADAWMVAMRSTMDEMGLREKPMAAREEPDFKIVVSQNDFLEALRKLKPSLSEEQMLYYQENEKKQLMNTHK